MEIPKPPEPILVGDLSVHLSYIRRDIDEIKNNQIKANDEMRNKLDSITNSYVTAHDFGEHLKADEDHELRIRTIEEFKSNLNGRMWAIGAVAGALSGLLGIVISHYWK